MSGTLYVDACFNRDTSRTERLAQALLDALGDKDFETVVLEDAGIRGLDSESLNMRNKAVMDMDFSDPMFDHARKFLDADTIVIAAPFWESCFPSTLKAYLEVVSVPRLCYRYTEFGGTVGNGHARIFYVTTRGGPASDAEDLGFEVVKATGRLFGDDDVRILSASGLDIIGNDVEAILAEAVGRIPDIIR